MSDLSFSKTEGGAMLAAVEECQDQGLVLWDWTRGSCSVEARSEFEVYIDVGCEPQLSLSPAVAYI